MKAPSPTSIFQSVESPILAGSDTRIIAGHGPGGDEADVERKIAMLKSARKSVAALVAQGMSLDEVLAADPLAEDHDEWDNLFIIGERMTTTLHQDAVATE